jgi:hypothetical protein
MVGTFALAGTKRAKSNILTSPETSSKTVTSMAHQGPVGIKIFLDDDMVLVAIADIAANPLYDFFVVLNRRAQYDCTVSANERELVGLLPHLNWYRLLHVCYYR